jgi:hypothetical protein
MIGLSRLSPHDRYGRPLHGQEFPHALRKMFDMGMVTEFKTKINMARDVGRAQGALPRVQVVFDSWHWSEKLITDNVVSELKSNRTQDRISPGNPQGGIPLSGRGL